MSLFSKFFTKSQTPSTKQEEPLVPVPIPALGALLISLEKQKGSPLSETDVIAARDKAVCIMLPVSAKLEMDKKRGYEDIDPENVWPEWLQLRSELTRGQP